MIETELKYTIPSRACAERMLRDPYFSGLAEGTDWEAVPMEAVYYDTPDGFLQQKGMAFRIRREGSKQVATLKFSGHAENGLHQREEINIYFNNISTDKSAKIKDDTGEYVALKNVSLTDFLQYRAFRETGIDPEKIQLIPFMKTDILRHCLEVRRDDCNMEIALDMGRISSGERSIDIVELEIELRDDEVEAVEQLLVMGEEIRQRYGLVPEIETKYSRGIKLYYLGRK